MKCTRVLFVMLTRLRIKVMMEWDNVHIHGGMEGERWICENGQGVLVMLTNHRMIFEQYLNVKFRMSLKGTGTSIRIRVKGVFVRQIKKLKESLELKTWVNQFSNSLAKNATKEKMWYHGISSSSKLKNGIYIIDGPMILRPTKNKSCLHAFIS